MIVCAAVERLSRRDAVPERRRVGPVWSLMGTLTDLHGSEDARPVRTTTSGATDSKLSFLAADHHGTSGIAVDATTQDVTKRYTTPFGASRGAKSTTWPDDKAFLGKPADTTTGLTHIGAREYDPTIGQFISVDPVLDPAQHQSLNGYAYGNNTPVTSADPTGTWIDDGTGHSEPRRDGGPAGPPSPTPGRSGGTPPSKGTHSSGGGGKSGGGVGSAVSGSGCDSPCQKALQTLAAKWKGGLYGSLAREVGKYVEIVAGDVRSCTEGSMASSGFAAGCADAAGIGSMDTWNDLLNDWVNGKGGVRTFGAGSLITQQLAGNRHSLDILERLQKKISDAGYEIDPSLLGGRSSYSDPKSNIFKDLRGMYTDGKKDSGMPEAFMGSCDQMHRVINVNKRDRSFTVAFAAYNETGVGSLTHFLPEIGQGKSMGTLHQTYYWTVTVSR